MTRPKGRPRASRVVWLCLCALSSCSKSGTPEALPPAPRFPPAAARIAGRMLAPSAFANELRQKIDPRRDGWTSEVSALSIETQLRTCVEQLLRGNGAPLDAWSALLAPGFRGATELFAAQRKQVFDDGTLRVEDPASALSSTPSAAAEFPAQLGRWRAALAGLPFESLDLHVNAIDVLPQGGVHTRIGLRVSARQGERGLQQNLVWDARWSTAADGSEPRLEELVLVESQFVFALHAVFHELTREVFGGLPCWPEELLRGANDYHLHQDRLSKQPMLGMHGIAIGDLDGDGLEDVYLGQPGGQPNRLFLRQKDGSVRDASVEAGVALLDNTGPVLIADLDGDGHEDLAIGIGGSILVRWNDGHGHLLDGVPLTRMLPGGIPDTQEITSMGAADVDNDGDLDLYACRYVAGGVIGGASVPYYNAENGARDLFWRNDGGHHFTEALEEVGLSEHTERFGLALYFEDFDEDGWVDLYVVNDFGRNCLYKNDHGHFHDVAPALGIEDQAAGMGADMADVDGDGLLDLYVTNMHSPAGGRIASQPGFMPEHPETRPDYVRHARGNTLLRAKGAGTFEDISDVARVSPAGWAWGSRFLDWSNSGWPSIFVPNGFVSNYDHSDLESFFWREVIARSPPAPPLTTEYAEAWETIRNFAMFEGQSWNGWEREYAYLNLGHGHFADVSAATQLDFLDDGRAAATIDWNDDGRMDLLLRNRSGPRLRLLLGAQSTTNHFLELALSSPGPNRDAVGAQVYVEAGGRRWRQSVHVSQGFLCASSRRLLFGLGTAKEATRISIRWPDGKREEFEHVAVDARYRVLEGSGKLEVRPREITPALDSLPGGRVEGQLSPEPRIVLFDKFPLQPLLLPSFGGAPGRVADHAGKVLLVAVGSFADPRSRAWMEWLGKARPALAQAGCDLHVALYDEPSGVEAAKRGLEALGLADVAGVAQQRFRQTLEVTLVEVLGQFPELPPPLLLVFDRGGALLEVQSAPEDCARLFEDVRIAGRIDAAREGTEALLGGEWARFVSREFDQVSKIYQTLGMNDLAQYYAALAQARARGRR